MNTILRPTPGLSNRLSRSTFRRPAALSPPPATRSANVRTNRTAVISNPIDPETDYQKLAADVTYTPGEKWTMNFRYRMLDLDSDGPATQSSNVHGYLIVVLAPTARSRSAEHRYRPQQLCGDRLLPSDSSSDTQRRLRARRHRPQSYRHKINFSFIRCIKPTPSGTCRATKRSTGSG